MFPVSHISHHFIASTTARSVAAIHYFGTAIIVTPIGVFMSWLTLHTHLAYAVLFAGAYFEALVGPSFFIPGELFLLSGSILAGTGVLDIWFVIVALYSGAILGDSSSFFIGRALGKSIFHERKRFLNIKNYKKIEAFLEKYGPKAIFFARLVGPFAKFAPVLAGIFEIPFSTFLVYNIPGVLVGCGYFIVAGYFFGDQYDLVLWVVQRYFIVLTLIVAVFLFIRWRLTRHYKKNAV